MWPKLSETLRTFTCYSEVALEPLSHTISLFNVKSVSKSACLRYEQPDSY